MVKRYVTEFANDLLNNSMLNREVRKHIKRVVSYYKAGAICSIEAIERILSVLKSCELKEETNGSESV